MAKRVSPNVLDNGLAYAKDNVERLVICSGEPVDHAGVAAVALGEIAFTAADVIGPEAVGAGRRVVYGAKTGIPITTAGTANHVALVKDSATAELLIVTTIANPQAVTASQNVDTAEFAHLFGAVV